MGGLAKKVYDKSPYFFKYLLLNFKGYLNAKQRYNSRFKSSLQEHIDLWGADIQDINDFQKKKLSKLLTEVHQHSQWYASIMKERKITLKEIESNPIEVLKRMPILEKSDRKKHVDLIVNTSRKTDMVNHTSGTTGSPTMDYLDQESINDSFAVWKRFHNVIGVKTKDKQVRFSGRLVINNDAKKPPFWVYNYFEKQLMMSTYHLKSENFKFYIEKLNKFKPKLIDGYPSAIFIISKFINKNKIKLSFVPKAIAVTSETLYDYQRIEIEKAFRCHVHNQYASNEGSPFITECTNGNLHVNLDSGIFEYVNNEGKPAKPGEIANLVVTSIIRFKTPLIRYNIGDTVLLPLQNEICNCNCNMPIVKKIIGREDDILWTEEKGYVVSADTALIDIEGIMEGQIIQENPKLVVVNLIVDDAFNKKMHDRLLNNLKDRLGEHIDYTINIVDNIPLGPNEKFDAQKRNFELKF